ncbi:hypothetical protein BJ912DRAFT_886147 [Pholiota molesta]|nr:hypothetical protein BJ912DRAFT_886147 [Pholiota molesta]
MSAHESDNLRVVPPELLPVIASFLPLRSAPATLYSLALGNRRLYHIVRPLIYSRLILRNERDALMILRRITDYPDIGRFVNELHILSDLEPLRQDERRGQDVLIGLSAIVMSGSLPALEALGIYLLMGWRVAEGYRNVPGHGNVAVEFWESLHRNCPRLRALYLRGLTSMTLDRRFNGSAAIADGINLLNLTRLTVDMWLTPPRAQDVSRKISDNLYRLAPTLQNLTLGFSTMVHLNTIPLFALHFPRLRSLVLKGFVPESVSSAVSFWERHPALERLFLVRYEGRWFPDQFQPRLLPNLKYLKATFADVRALAPVLPGLVSLSITLAVNGQIPYLLRSVIPTGLPCLRSLEFVHFNTAMSPLAEEEGAKWYETAEGIQIEAMSVDDATLDVALQTFMLSIARGVPNIEELGFRSNAWESTGLLHLCPYLAQFRVLKRIYYPACFNVPDRNVQASEAEIRQRVHDLAAACLHLESVTDTEPGELPYRTARIKRGADGIHIQSVSVGYGQGMELLECERSNPFPQNIPMS